MGNRAVITTCTDEDVQNSNEIGVYIHWNGNCNCVEAFLTYCELKGYREPTDDNYGWARLCQVIGNYFGGECSVGIDKCCCLDCDNGDNGTYIIDGWKIVDQKYSNPYDGTVSVYEYLCAINDSMPKAERLDISEFEPYKTEKDDKTKDSLKDTWSKYLKYLEEWAQDKADDACLGQSPSSYDEWLENEYALENGYEVMQ